VNRRFQIEDLIIQDASGVVFRAMDTETGRPVAVRRFFPFGAHGGGLHDDEQAAYNIALGRLAGLKHPSMRSVISGGCDPVDGIPFIATEWIEGDVLDPILQRGPLPVEAAVELLTQALEVCELLSHVLAEEAVWVETDPQSIVLGNAESGRGFTFWISPLKWLGGEETRGLYSIIELAERVMGWQNQIVNDQAGNGLGAWLNWLRGAKSTHLREVRENLAAAIGKEPPPPARELVVQATRPVPRKSSKVAVLAGLGLTLIFTGLSGWLLTRSDELLAEADTEPSQSKVAETNQRAEELSAQAAQKDREREDLLARQNEALKMRDGVYSIAEGDLLALKNNQPATLEGHFAKIESSQSGKTLYLNFTDNPAATEPRGSVLLRDAPDLDRQSLESFLGKKIRLTGQVQVRGNRPEIVIVRQADIQLLE